MSRWVRPDHVERSLYYSNVSNSARPLVTRKGGRNYAEQLPYGRGADGPTYPSVIRGKIHGYTKWWQDDSGVGNLARPIEAGKKRYGCTERWLNGSNVNDPARPPTDRGEVRDNTERWVNNSNHDSPAYSVARWRGRDRAERRLHCASRWGRYNGTKQWAEDNDVDSPTCSVVTRGRERARSEQQRYEHDIDGSACSIVTECGVHGGAKRWSQDSDVANSAHPLEGWRRRCDCAERWPHDSSDGHMTAPGGDLTRSLVNQGKEHRVERWLDGSNVDDTPRFIEREKGVSTCTRQWLDDGVDSLAHCIMIRKERHDSTDRGLGDPAAGSACPVEWAESNCAERQLDGRGVDGLACPVGIEGGVYAYSEQCLDDSDVSNSAHRTNTTPPQRPPASSYQTTPREQAWLGDLVISHADLELISRVLLICSNAFLLYIYACGSAGGSSCQPVLDSAPAPHLRNQRQDLTQLVEFATSSARVGVILLMLILLHHCPTCQQLDAYLLVAVQLPAALVVDDRCHIPV